MYILSLKANIYYSLTVFLRKYNIILASKINPFTATSSDALHNASEKTFYQITHTIHLLETIHKIIPYRPGKPTTFLD